MYSQQFRNVQKPPLQITAEINTWYRLWERAVSIARSTGMITGSPINKKKNPVGKDRCERINSTVSVLKVKTKDNMKSNGKFKVTETKDILHQEKMYFNLQS